jgi:serine O-acetyltransferase
MSERKENILSETAKKMAVNYGKAEIPMYGKKLRLPEREAVNEILRDFRRLFFPAYFGQKELVSLPPEQYAGLLLNRLYDKLLRQICLALPEDEEERAHEICDDLFERLPEIQETVHKDLSANFEGDPAASSKEEVLFAYPGLFAIFVHRIAHELYMQKVPMIPRIMAEYAHSRTGIDINPGATIGEYFFIDHGTGVVVGETARIGNHVKLYQGSTLGALSPTEGQHLRGVHRHPSVGDNVTVYANATILGGDTHIGSNTIIGGNTFITRSIESDARVGIKAPELVIKGGN